MLNCPWSCRRVRVSSPRSSLCIGRRITETRAAPACSSAETSSLRGEWRCCGRCSVLLCGGAQGAVWRCCVEPPLLCLSAAAASYCGGVRLKSRVTPPAHIHSPAGDHGAGLFDMTAVEESRGGRSWSSYIYLSTVLHIWGTFSFRL